MTQAEKERRLSELQAERERLAPQLLAAYERAIANGILEPTPLIEMFLYEVREGNPHKKP